MTTQTQIPPERRLRRNPGGDKWLRRLSLSNLDALSRDGGERYDTTRELDLQQLIEQLGGALLHISGGRLIAVANVAYLPVDVGYVVAIELAPSDTYTVRRLRLRSGRLTEHGEAANVYCDELAAFAVRAGAFESYRHEEWP